MSAFSVGQHPLAQLVSDLRARRGVSEEWRRRHESSMGKLWNECAEPGVLLDVLFLATDQRTWVAASQAVLEEARRTLRSDFLEALRDVCNVIRAMAPAPPSLAALSQGAASRSARDLDAMEYPLDVR